MGKSSVNGQFSTLQQNFHALLVDELRTAVQGICGQVQLPDVHGKPGPLGGCGG